MDVHTNIDLASAIALWGILVSAVIAFGVARLAWGSRGHERLAKERGLPVLGKIPMEAVYALVLPIGRGLARIGVTANAVSTASLAIAAAAGVLFATGHFGAGAAVAVVATLADALDGIVARATKTASKFGQVLDTTIDRYVDAVLLGGIAVYVRTEVWLLVLTMAAVVGGFMVSYASSVLRELKVNDDNAPMRRAHRVAYVLGAAMLVPFVEAALPNANVAVRLSPIVAALSAIAVVGNASAVRRLLRTARSVSASATTPVAKSAPTAPHGRSGLEPVVTRERLPFGDREARP